MRCRVGLGAVRGVVVTRQVQNIAERAARAAGIAYCAVWQSSGLGYDTMFSVENAKAAAVGAVLSLALSAGFLRAGDKDSGGIY